MILLTSTLWDGSQFGYVDDARYIKSMNFRHASSFSWRLNRVRMSNMMAVGVAASLYVIKEADSRVGGSLLFNGTQSIDD